jgi:hypothetical protein
MKEILIEEYKVLKSEQLTRIKHRDNIIYVLLGAIGTLFSFAIIHQATYVVAIVPMISFVLCWLYLANDRKISEIATYINNDLSQKLSLLLEKDKQTKEGKEKKEKEVFAWETKHKQYKGRKIRKLIQFIVDIFVFAFPALTGVLMVYTEPNKNYVFYVDLMFFVGIVILFVLHYSNKDVTQEE